MRVWSGVLGEWLYWVRDEMKREALIKQDIEPRCIYTLGELTVIASWTGDVEERHKALRNVHTMKREFSATIEPVRVKYKGDEDGK